LDTAFSHLDFLPHDGCTRWSDVVEVGDSGPVCADGGYSDAS